MNNTCALLYQLPPLLDKCAFVVQNCLDEQLGLVNYFQLYYCHNNQILIVIGTILQTLILFISLGLVSSEFLCPNLSTISSFLQIPDNLSGLTLLLFGNGSPDILGTYTSFMSGSGSLAVGELIGSLFLITSLVIGVMSVVHPFKIYNSDSSLLLNTQRQEKLIFIRDAIFFITSVILVIFFLSDGKLEFWECLVMNGLYIMYVIVIIGWNWILKFTNERILLESRIRNVYNFNDLDEYQFMNDLEETVSNTDDTLENFSTLMRPSLFEALEFQNVVLDLQLKQSLPISVVSDDRQLELIRQSTNNNVVEDEFNPTEYELQHSSSENIEDIDLDTTSGVRKLLNLKYYTTNLQDKAQLIQLFPLLSEFDNSNIIKKITLLICLPTYLLLKLTVPVTNINDNSALQKLLLIQTLLAPILISIAATYGSTPSLTVPLLCSTILCSITYISQKRDSIQLTSLISPLLGFLSAISWISIIATDLVSSLKFFGFILRISDLILGLTLFAMGNSIGDLISNFTITRMGFPLMALLLCFGGPLLNLLLGVGLNGILVLQFKKIPHVEISIDPSLIISSICLLLNLVFMLVAVPYSDWTFTRQIGIVMIGVWCLGTLINVIMMSI